MGKHRDEFDSQHGYYIEDLETGMSASVKKVFSERDVASYAELSTDANPLHLDEEFASRTRTGGRIIHGMITASLISALVGTRLPGPGCLWMSQELRFLKPVRVGDEVSAEAEVIEVCRTRQRVAMSTVCRVGREVVVEGRAWVWVPART